MDVSESLAKPEKNAEQQSPVPSDNNQLLKGEAATGEKKNKSGKDAIANLDETIDPVDTDRSIVENAHKKESSNEWVCIGEFRTDDETVEISRRLELHSGRKVRQKSGLKCYFYCSRRYKTEGCEFKAYSMQPTENAPISMYKLGQHNHGTSTDGTASKDGTDRSLRLLAQQATASSCNSNDSMYSDISSVSSASSKTTNSSIDIGDQSADALNEEDSLLDSGQMRLDDNGDDSRQEKEHPKGLRKYNHRDWISVGDFASEDELFQARRPFKVSAQKTHERQNGWKTIFFCNSRSQKKCDFQMYTFKPKDKNGLISLFKSGQHNHSLITRAYAKRSWQAKNEVASRSKSLDIGSELRAKSSPSATPRCNKVGLSLFSSINREAASTLDLTASKSGSATRAPCCTAEVTELMIDDGGPSSKRLCSANRARKQLIPKRIAVCQSSGTYSLKDDQSVARLTEIATVLRLTVTINARKQGEFCFTVGSSGLQKSVVVTDTGATVTVEEMFGNQQLDVELWTKADFPQFAWAIKAKCQNALFP